jgi:hypothetical protein
MDPYILFPPYVLIDRQNFILCPMHASCPIHLHLFECKSYRMLNLSKFYHPVSSMIIGERWESTELSKFETNTWKCSFFLSVPPALSSTETKNY